MVFAAAHGDSILLQRTQPRQRLSGVGDLCVCAGNQLHTLVGGGGDAAHVLQNVQRRPLTLEQRLGAAGHSRDDIALLDLLAVVNADVHGEVAAHQLKHALCNVDAAEHAAVLCQIVCFAGVAVVQQIVGGDIDVVDVLLQCCGNQSVDIGLL